jgi:ribosomal protein L18E
MKVLADGILNKPLTIKSESYSIQAIKMIELTGGTVIILRD